MFNYFVYLICLLNTFYLLTCFVKLFNIIIINIIGVTMLENILLGIVSICTLWNIVS